MTNEEIAVNLTKNNEEIKSLKHRMDDVETKQNEIETLTASVNKLAINMEYMLKEQKDQGNRLKQLEIAPLDGAKQLRATVISSIVTAVIGAIIGALLALIIK